MEGKEKLIGEEMDKESTKPEIPAETTPVKRKRIRKPPGVKREGFKYTCEQCLKGFNGKIPLAKHYRVAHFVVKPFKCHVCDKSFASIRTLNDHNLVNHTEKSANICDICGKSFSSVSTCNIKMSLGHVPCLCWEHYIP